MNKVKEVIETEENNNANKTFLKCLFNNSNIISTYTSEINDSLNDNNNEGYVSIGNDIIIHLLRDEELIQMSQI
ncbi:hypothetical protein ABK040_007415 [Willaertia magna]